MACHLTLRVVTPPEVALPPPDTVPVVAWDEDRGVYLIGEAAANDDRPRAGLGLVTLPDMRPRGLLGRLGVAPDDADALMRSLASWAAAFFAAGAIIRWV